jgi:hypothetical protein
MSTGKIILAVVGIILFIVVFVIIWHYTYKYCSGADSSSGKISNSYVDLSGKKSQTNRVQQLNRIYRGTLPKIN